MNNKNSLEFIGVHAEGEIGRVLLSGAPDIPGATLTEKMNYINNEDGTLVHRSLFEPHGSANMTVNLMLEPTTAKADIAFIPLQPDGAHAISGSNCICVTTAALETGKVQMEEPVSHVVIETPAGLVQATAQCRDGKCEKVTVRMAPSFVESLDHPLDVPELGKLNVDVAYGGCFFVLVDADAIGVHLERSAARRLIDLAAAIKKSANDQIQIKGRPGIDMTRVEYVIFTSSRGGKFVNCNIIHPGRVDRSPCGTGSGARLATMHARGLVAKGETVDFYSLIDSKFECRIAEAATTEHGDTITHEITGRAWTYSRETHWVDPSDPYPTGYVLSDTWGPDI